jgi:hypothetical protein
MPSRRRFFGNLTAAGAATDAIPARAQPGAQTLEIGPIGCGGRGAHLAGVVQPLAQEGEPAAVVAVCDFYQPRRERAAQCFSAKAYATVSDLLADPRVQGVIVATPDRVHVYNALEATRAGKVLYCEEPSYVEGKVAYSDGATETIRMG